MISIRVSHPEFAAQYIDPVRPVDEISAGSNHRALWICALGHTWHAAVATRIAQKQGCPVCSNKIILAGFNDLASKHPKIAKQWSPRNAKKATEVSSGSSLSVWWVCELGHEWKAGIASRVRRNSGCGVCMNKILLKGFNDLAYMYPEIAAEWDESNSKRADEVFPGSIQRATWRCKLGHTWDAPIVRRTRQKTGCPSCAGQIVIPGVNDLATTSPDIAAEHDDPIIPLSSLMRTSNIKVWWKGLCGHRWQALVSNRTRKGDGCPICYGRQVLVGFNDVAYTHPHLMPEWSSKNTILPTQITAGSDTMIIWECAKGHEWSCFMYSRTGKNPGGCSVCSSSQGEKDIVRWLEEIGVNNIVLHDRKLIKPYEVDIFLSDYNIAIEYNGIYWHSEKMGKDSNYHVNKLEMTKAAGIRLIQVWEDDWVHKKELIKRLILARIGLSDQKRIGARKTSPSIITVDRAAVFLDNNHIQGRVAGSFYFGLEHAGELVAVMVFTKQGKGSTSVMLDRYATSAGVPGGFSKLLKFALSQMPGVTEVVTFADREISQGDLYEQTGFVKDRILPPDYKYVVNGKRVHKFNYRKARIKADPNLKYKDGMTERELMALNGIPRVWDSGKIRYVFTY